MPEDKKDSHRRLDSAAFGLIGTFFVIMAILVIFGVVINDEGLALGVGICAGVLFLLIGVGGVTLGLRFRRESK